MQRFRTEPAFWGLMTVDDRPSEAPLLADLARDLDGAFEGLVLAHQDRLFSIALRMLGDPRDAEEATQDAFVRAYRALADYDESRIHALRLRGWLATIVLNLCRTRTTKRAARGRGPLSLDAAAQAGAPDPVAPGGRGPLAVVERDDDRSRWAQRLAELPVGYRAAVVLRHVDGLTYPELATALGRPEGTVKAQVHRGIAMLRTMLEAERRLEREEMTA